MRQANLITTLSLSLPPDSYIYKILPTSSHLAAISSDDSLRLLDPKTLRESAGGVLNHVHDGVTCLQITDHDPHSLLTAGRDAAVRGFDMRSGLKTLELGDDSKAPYLSLATHGTNIAAGTELSNSEAAVLIWDTRSPHHPLRTYPSSHNDDITALSFHPTQQPQRLLSGSADGLVNTYDTSFSDEDDALLQVENHGSAINRSGFLSEADFFALSTDETFAVYRLNDGDDEGGGRGDAAAATQPQPSVFRDLRPRLECEYIVDVLPSTPSSVNVNVSAIIAAASHTQHHLDLIPLLQRQSKTNNGWDFDTAERIRLPGAHGEEVVRSVLVDDKDGTIFTAGEDGCVRAWRAPADGGQGGSETERLKKGTTKKKKKGTADGASDVGKRYKPY